MLPLQTIAANGIRLQENLLCMQDLTRTIAAQRTMLLPFLSLATSTLNLLNFQNEAQVHWSISNLGQSLRCPICAGLAPFLSFHPPNEAMDDKIHFCRVANSLSSYLEPALVVPDCGLQYISANVRGGVSARDSLS